MFPYKVDVTSPKSLTQGYLLVLAISTWMVKETCQIANLKDLAKHGMSVLCIGYPKKDGSGEHDDCQLNITGKSTQNDLGAKQAAAREVHEETGMFVNYRKLIPCGQATNTNRTHDLFRVKACDLYVHRHKPIRTESGKDNLSTRVVCTIFGPHEELIKKANQMANNLRRPGRNPDGIAYFVVMSAQDALFACREVLSAPFGVRQIEVDFETNHMPIVHRRRGRDERDYYGKEMKKPRM